MALQRRCSVLIRALATLKSEVVKAAVLQCMDKAKSVTAGEGTVLAHIPTSFSSQAFGIWKGEVEEIMKVLQSKCTEVGAADSGAIDRSFDSKCKGVLVENQAVLGRDRSGPLLVVFRRTFSGFADTVASPHCALYGFLVARENVMACAHKACVRRRGLLGWSQSCPGHAKPVVAGGCAWGL